MGFLLSPTVVENIIFNHLVTSISKCQDLAMTRFQWILISIFLHRGHRYTSADRWGMTSSISSFNGTRQNTRDKAHVAETTSGSCVKHVGTQRIRLDTRLEKELRVHTLKWWRNNHEIKNIPLPSHSGTEITWDQFVFSVFTFILEIFVSDYRTCVYYIAPEFLFLTTAQAQS